MKILAIDDKREVLEEVIKYLPDHEITMAGSGVNAASKLVDNQKYDLILTDYSMPDMTGLELIGAIKGNDMVSERILECAGINPADFADARNNYKGKPIILMTSTTNDMLISSASSAGAEAVIQKNKNQPYLNKEELAEMIGKYDARDPAKNL